MSVALWRSAVVVAVLLAHPAAARAQGQGGSGGGGGGSCSISVTGINFGTYNVFNGTPLVSTGGLTFRCNPGGVVQIWLSAGQSGTYHSRALFQAVEPLSYNLYRNATRSEIWGDGSSGTFEVSIAAEKNTWIPLTIYAEIPPMQDVTAGSYTDIITATINF